MASDLTPDMARTSKQDLLVAYPGRRVARKRIQPNRDQRQGRRDRRGPRNRRQRPHHRRASSPSAAAAMPAAKGVVLGPTRDIVNLVHGPIGCSFYAWLTRRNQTRPPTPEDENYMTYCFSTDMQEEEIIFGGEKKLRAAIQEAYDLFHPKAIGVFSTCPVGLIGDDVHAVARRHEGEAGHQRLRLQLRRLQGRQPVGRPPHRQQPVVQARHRPRRHASARASSASTCWANTTSAATPS